MFKVCDQNVATSNTRCTGRGGGGFRGKFPRAGRVGSKEAQYRKKKVKRIGGERSKNNNYDY